MSAWDMAGPLICGPSKVMSPSIRLMHLPLARILGALLPPATLETPANVLPTAETVREILLIR